MKVRLPDKIAAHGASTILPSESNSIDKQPGSLSVGVQGLCTCVNRRRLIGVWCPQDNSAAAAHWAELLTAFSCALFHYTQVPVLLKKEPKKRAKPTLFTT